MRRTALAIALGMGLLSALCACGNRESEGNAMETIGAESAEANMGYQSERNSGQLNQTEQEEVRATTGYETREIHVDKEGMDIYGVVHIPSGTEGKTPTVILSHELGATLDRVKGYGKIPLKQYSIEAIQNAYRHGCTLFDTAEIYSPNLAGIGHNEDLTAFMDIGGKDLENKEEMQNEEIRIWICTESVDAGPKYGMAFAV